MISMTGYGRSERHDDTVAVAVEVKSVNNRYLDVNVTLPGSMSPIEQPIRERVSQTVSRGRVDVYVRVREYAEELSVRVDRSVVAGSLRAINDLRDTAGLDDPVTLDHILSCDGVLKTERDTDADRYWRLVEPVLGDALGAFATSRTTEGARLGEDIDAQIARVDAALVAVRGAVPQIEEGIRRNLSERFREVVGDSIEETRMLAEVAVQLARFSVNEEVVRLGAHIDAFRAACGRPEPVGKRLDFLCQEMHREVNTIGSKSTVLAISEQVIEAKDALENVREQLRNVE